MHTLKTKLNHWYRSESLQQLNAFLRYLLKRFIDDRCFETAGYLSYTTILAVVPIATIVFSVLSAFPIFDQWTNQLINFAFGNFIPSVAAEIEWYVKDFTHSAKQLPIIGLFGLLLSVAVTMWSVEQAFNRIWRVSEYKLKFFRFMVYWAVLVFGALSIVALLALNSVLSVYFNVADYASPGMYAIGLQLFPFLLELIIFVSIYGLLPHKPVRFRFALIGGLCAAGLFELLKWAFGIYLSSVSLEKIYGALAVLPIFLIWIYCMWAVVLLCASLTASLADYHYSPRMLRHHPALN